MIKLYGKFFVLTAMLCMTFAFAGCSSTTPTNSNNAVVTSNTNSKPANTTTTTNTTTTNTTTTGGTTASGDKIGVAECDEYIEKLEACLTSAPEASRAMVKSNLDMMRKSWKDAAATPQGKAGLQTGCKAALDSAKSTYSYCKW